jgi:hypothetical protein
VRQGTILKFEMALDYFLLNINTSDVYMAQEIPTEIQMLIHTY